MTGHTVVVTDSAASLPERLAAEYDIVVVPLTICIGDETFDEGVSITHAQILEALADDRQVSTSQPSVEAFAQTYRRAEASGASAVVAVLIGSSMSGTVGNAEVAADAVDIPVTVIDTQSVALATGFTAIAAARAGRAGADAEQIADVAREVAASATCVFTVDTLEYLHRGGRISSAAAAMGRMLSVRPVLEIIDGEVHVTHRVRSTPRARDAVLATASAAIEEMDAPAVGVMTVGHPDAGDDAVRTLRMRHEGLSSVVQADVSAVLAVHAGPGALAIVAADFDVLTSLE
ncbi:DegV family protein [Demequina sediminicola]|uniref:DegV family protein n=1 Tax=Demequina sediminicola TaxID=1095026 RepID=UPI0007812076|nr:DegV family protein [Demequina sediminicola]